MAQQDITIGVADAKTGDTSFSAWTKAQANFDELFSASNLTRRVIVNTLADLPAAVSSVITLADNTMYVQADDLDLSTTRLVFGANTVYSGIDSLVVTLSYVGTLPLFTLTNVTGSVKDINVTHPNSALFSYSDSGSHVLRISDVTNTGSSYGTFGGTSSGLRLTNASSQLTSNGLLFTGNWVALLFEPALSGLAAGTFIDLATATFDSISINETNLTLVVGTFFLSGELNSANINAGGLGSVTLSRLKGGGTPLDQITEDDNLWEFNQNNAIRDTRANGLLSMQNNSSDTAIASADTPVLAAGTWTVGPVGQFTGSTAGRLTYTGGKPARLPITFSVSVEPAVSTGIAMSAYIAIDGVIRSDSRRQGTGSAGGPTSITLPWQENFSTGTYVEVFVENNTNATDILVSSAIGRVN